MIVDMASGTITASVGDIHIRDGEIIGIGASIAAPAAAERIDMTGMLITPGLVDTHWHMWNSLARGFAMSRLGPFAKTMAALSKIWTPEASGLSVRLATAEAVKSGITCVHNWSHNTKGTEFAEAELAAMEASGIRGRYSYGYPQALKPDEKMDFAALREFRAAHFPSGSKGLIHLGLCTRGPDRSDEQIWQEEWEVARDLAIPITTHIASDRKAGLMGNIAKMASSGYLGPDVQLVHATHATAEDFAKIAAAKSPVSISPWTELEVGYGVPPIAGMASANLNIGLSVDNLVLAGNADMFTVMKLAADLAAGQSENQGAVPDDSIFGWATAGGASSLNLGHQVGVLKSGLRADIIAVRMKDLNTVNAMSPAFLLTHAARPENVDFVMIDGQVHKQGGVLTRIDETDLKAEAGEMIDKLRRNAGL
jgi:cytosine/adenosine deaminase-related metal-dependent hydrolase